MKTLLSAFIALIAAMTVSGAMLQLASESRADNLPPTTDLAALRSGEKVYNETCVACHGPDGEGTVPGAPNFAKMKGVLATESDKVLLAHILDGFQSPGAPLAMPPKGGNEALTIKEVRHVLAYLHQHFHYKKY